MEGSILLTKLDQLHLERKQQEQDLKFVRILATTHCTFEPFKDTQEEK